MQKTEPFIADTIQKSLSQITDVNDFFSEITKAYLRFKENVLHLDHLLSTFSPAQIVEECNRISEKKSQLAALDQQMLAIISLVGNEIADEPIVHDYRVAFAGAQMACTNLSRNLRALQHSLKESTTISCQTSPCDTL
jgi:hypothetical protein